jgi:hypothetical protein
MSEAEVNTLKIPPQGEYPYHNRRPSPIGVFQQSPQESAEKVVSENMGVNPMKV